MFINIGSKKKANSFLESLIVFMFVFLIANLSIKIIYNNYLKAQNFITYKDSRSLGVEEEKALLIINNNSKNVNLSRDELFEVVKNKELSENSELKKFQLVYENKSYYLRKNEKSLSFYIKLDEKIVDEKSCFIPSGYKTKGIYSKE